MRPIHIARLDRPRPVLVLTHELARPHLNTVTVAPITTSVRGISTEVPLIRGERQESMLSEAIRFAFDLD